MLDINHSHFALIQKSAGRAVSFLRLLANENRLMILCQLAEGELTVGALQSRIGLSQSALSQHLALLREEALVATRRDKQSIYYTISDPAVLNVISALAEIFCPVELRK